MPIKQWCVYLLVCSDQTLYCGATNDLQKRLKTHNAGKGSRYTRARLPVKLYNSFECTNKSEALRLEYRIKQMSRKEKQKFQIPESDKPIINIRRTNMDARYYCDGSGELHIFNKHETVLLISDGRLKHHLKDAEEFIEQKKKDIALVEKELLILKAIVKATNLL